ncbi:MAG: glycosyltransferase family 87 protein [Lishizhenia sp.]
MQIFNSIGSFFKAKNQPQILVVLLFVVFALMLVIENINGRFWHNDFKVMYSASEAFFNGEQVYGKSFGLSTGFYKYSPESLWLFAPYLLFTFKVAAVLHYAVILMCTIGLFLNLRKLFSTHIFPQLTVKFPSLLFLPALVFSMIHLVREFHLGNVNVILVFLISWSILALLEKKETKAGVIMATVVFVKPYFILLVLGFILIKSWKSIYAVVLFGLSAILLFSLFTGFKESYILHLDWLKSMLDHSSYLTSNHTVFSLIETHFGLTLPMANSPIYLFVFGLLFFVFLVVRKSKHEVFDYIFYTLLILAFVPNVIITDVEHFLFAVPSIVYLTYAIFNSKQFWWFVPFLLVLFMFGGDSNDLLGKTLSDFVDQKGFLGISNLIILVSSAILGLKIKK